METKQRIYRQIKIYGAVLGILFLYYLWVRFTGLALLCPFHTVTGFLCPGCGITRACMSLAAGDFARAYSYNQAIFWLAPLVLADVVWFHYFYFRYGKKKSRFHTAAVTIMLVVLLVFCVWRNLSDVLHLV